MSGAWQKATLYNNAHTIEIRKTHATRIFICCRIYLRMLSWRTTGRKEGGVDLGATESAKGDPVQMILDTYTHYIPDDSIDSF
jgi:hypothetical protein